MKKLLLFIALGLTLLLAYAQANAASLPDSTTVKDTVKTKPEPFAFGDFTWLNGNDRRHKALLDTKYFTGRFLLDFNYTASNNNPIDLSLIHI